MLFPTDSQPIIPCFYVKTPEQAALFYRNVFAAEQLANDSGIIKLSLFGKVIVIKDVGRDYLLTHAAHHLKVNHIEQVLTLAKEAGAMIDVELAQYPEGYHAAIIDPFGQLWELYQTA
ncbi:hypothetical protein [Shewanella marina]|uniref:hypothetical protein n=1 Tax=Shewanella marina TaxID=487319 RepID=UPI000471A1F6|nr:hypothetical protein [Shewanella marina]